MPDWMIIGVLFSLLIAWKIRDNELKREPQAEVAVADDRIAFVLEPKPVKPTVTVTRRGSLVVCRVLIGADQPGHKPLKRAANKGEAWDLCCREGAKLGIKQHWWRKDHGNSNGAVQWYAYKRKAATD